MWHFHDGSSASSGVRPRRGRPSRRAPGPRLHLAALAQPGDFFSVVRKQVLAWVSGCLLVPDLFALFAVCFVSHPCAFYCANCRLECETWLSQTCDPQTTFSNCRLQAEKILKKKKKSKQGFFPPYFLKASGSRH